jgi:hypothetical protein
MRWRIGRIQYDYSRLDHELAAARHRVHDQVHDRIDMEQNPLWCDSLPARDIEALKSRGVEVREDGP